MLTHLHKRTGRARGSFSRLRAKNTSHTHTALVIALHERCPHPACRRFSCISQGRLGAMSIPLRFPTIHDINVSAALRNYHLNPRLGACERTRQGQLCGPALACCCSATCMQLFGGVRLVPLAVCCVLRCRLLHHLRREWAPGHPGQREGSRAVHRLSREPFLSSAPSCFAGHIPLPRACAAVLTRLSPPSAGSPLR